MPRSSLQTSTVASLALFLFLAHASLASPIVKLAQPIVIKTSLNATSAMPLVALNGPNRYAALALGAGEGNSLESRELREYFEESELIARGLEVGEAAPTPAPVSQAETAAKPERTQHSLFSFFSRPIFKVKNPKYIWNPKAHAPRTSTTSSWSSVVSSTAAPSSSKTSSSTTAKKSTTTTQKATSTTTSAAPTSTLVACSLTADCAGQPIPDFSHQYCASRLCSFRCNTGFTEVNGACLKNRPSSTTTTTTTTTKVATTTTIPPAVPSPMGCFPSSRSDIPTTPATTLSLQQWWCPETTEYAFLGFSYALYSCPTQSELLADFKRMKSEFNARYVRLYGYCDEWWMNDALVEAAAGAGIGIYGLIWFGFEGTDEWKGRRDALVKTIQYNPKAPYVYRNIAVGSEPLYDWAIEPWALANEINSLRSKLSPYGIKITTSEMPYGFQIHTQDGGPAVAQAVDFVETNVLPFFDGSATTGDRAWGMVSWSLDFFRKLAPGKRIVMTQTGWPSDTSVWKANTPTAVASVWSEKAYFDLLDSKCEEFRWNGGVGWFAQIWSDSQLGGWGILDWNGNKKFDFRPRTTC